MFLLKLGSYLYFLVFCSFCAEDLLLPKQNYKLQFLEKFIRQIIQKPQDTTVVLNKAESFKELKLNLRPIIIHNNYSKELRFVKLMKTDAYIITLPIEISDELFKSLTLQSQWNPRAKFIIVIHEENTKNLISILRKFYIFNVVILKVLSEEEIAVYTYFPYNKSTFENGRSEVLLSKCISGVLENYVNLFPEKLPQTWKDTVVKVALIKYPPYVLLDNCQNVDLCGIEVDVLKLVSHVHF